MTKAARAAALCIVVKADHTYPSVDDEEYWAGQQRGGVSDNESVSQGMGRVMVQDASATLTESGGDPSKTAAVGDGHDDQVSQGSQSSQRRG